MSNVLSTLAAFVLCAGPVHVAAVAWVPSGVAPAVADAAVDRLIAPMRERGVSVTDRLDLAPEQRACDKPECLREIAAEVNATAVMTGTLTKTDGGFTAGFRVYEPQGGKLLISDVLQAETEAELYELMDRLGRRTVLDLYDAFRLHLQLRVPPFMVFAGGLSLTVIGTVLLGLAQVDASRLEGDVSGLSVGDIHSVASTGRSLQAAAPVLLGVGGAMLLVAAVWLAISPYDFSKPVTQ